MINAILRIAVYRPILTLSLALLVIAAGIWAFPHLNIDAVPDITNVQVQINTEAPGYSPLEAEQRITFPLETALAGLPGLDYTRSLSRYGLSQITAVFHEDTDLYFARNRVNEQLAAIKNQLPDGLEPVMGPISTGLGEIYSYVVEAEPEAHQANGKPYDVMALREIQDWIIQPQLARVPGVVEINTIGGFDRQYHVLPRLHDLLQFKLTLEDLQRALKRNNANRGAGYIEKEGQQQLVRSPAQLHSLQEIRDVIIAYQEGLPIHVSDVANVAFGHELRTGAATYNGEESIIGTAMMLVGENSRAVAQDVAERLEQIQPSLPDGVHITPVYDRTTLVDKTIATVQKNLLEGALLVIAVLFLLLGNLRAALITAAIIPLAMLFTIWGMVQTKVSANLMSLGALDFGLIVDGAVIIVENAICRLSQAQANITKPLALNERLHIVYEATGEVIRPSLFGIAIITAVYIPIFSLTGVEGKMFHPMAATVIIALIAAMIFSLTLVPAAVALFLRNKIQIHENVFVAGIRHVYRPILALALRLRYLVITVTLCWLVFCGWLASSLGSEFVPQLDEGDIALHALRIPGTGLEQSVTLQKALEKTILTFPEVQRVFSRIGTPEVATDPMPPNVADTFVMLAPRESWPNPAKTKSQLIEEIQETIKHLPGNNYEFTQPIEMRFNELISGVRADVAIKLFGDDLDQLQQSANTILQAVNTVEGAQDARIEQVSGLPILTVTPERLALSRYQLDSYDLQNWLATTIGGMPVGVIYEGDRRFQLIIRLPEEQRMATQELERLPFPLPGDEFVPLGEIATIQLEPGPSQISRENGKRRIVITANVRDRDLGSFVTAVQQQVKEQVALPAGYWLEYGGTFEQLESASQRLRLVIPVTLFLILGILTVAFSSLRDALIIFSGVPFALTGGILALWLREMPLSISAGIGFIALSGIAVLNGLVMVSFIREHLGDEMNLREAVFSGAISRLRPVIMTALVASLGFIPMALNTGTGAEVQSPLATVVIGGIITSTILTLLVLPSLYLMGQAGTHST